MLTLTLTPERRSELEVLERRGQPAHLREKAHALLLVADGLSCATVARHHLLLPRQPDTVRRWLRWYLAEGVAGLRIREGRGRKPLPFRPRPGCHAAQGSGQRAAQGAPA